MRMQKEEMIVVVLLLMVIGSLAVAFWAFGPEDDAAKSPSKSKSLNAGLSVEGMVTEINPTRTGENLLIRLDSTSIPIFIPRTSGAKELSSRLKKGDSLRVKGIQKEFQGQEEIEVSRSSDVQIVN
jgi:DNA/RNA endonuclease YhcR with UshA esterase domain